MGKIEAKIDGRAEATTNFESARTFTGNFKRLEIKLKCGEKFICFSTALYLHKMQINQATKMAFSKNDLTYFQKNVLYRPHTECGEMAEQAEGAPLLREYGVKNSIEGSNPSLTAICCQFYLFCTRSSAGQSTRLRTERSKVRILSGAPSSFFKLSVYQKQLTLYLVIFLDHQQFLINNFLVCL